MMASKNDKKSSHSPKSVKNNKKPEANTPVEPSNRADGLKIVGIGASAGGLQALRSFFAALPGDTGMSFVVVTHLHPEHESHLAELLQAQTSMPTVQVSQKTRVEANHVYVIPPNRSIVLTDSHLETREFDQPHGLRTPIDHFFRSMASGRHNEPVAIILSGGGTDGSVGIKDVKEVGGVIMVQQPDDAEYDSMPRAALSTGLADIVLPAGLLAQKLADFGRHTTRLPHDPGQLTEAESETLQRIMAQVHARTGNDFSQYKRSTILRRVERRLQLNNFDTLEAYLAFLRSNGTEAHAMFNDILIGVTNFFRDRDSWEALHEQVIPLLFKQKRNGENEGIRVWSVGCATGEEAYGLVMLLMEEADKLDVQTHIQVFASDLDERSIAHGREGLYPAAIEADVSPERLERFFKREGDYYRIKREVRDAVLFTNHNVLRDPPFSRQNLIACRNVLIYLQRSIQDRLFDIFHYSLIPGGYLFLGNSESVEHLPTLFNVISKSHRIYRAKHWMGERNRVPSMPFHARRTNLPRETSPRHLTGRLVDEVAMPEEQHYYAIETYGPPSLVVNQRNAILHVSETAGRYLLQPKGPITGDVISLVRPELQFELRNALFHAFEKGKASVSRPISVRFNGHTGRVVISVRPRHEPEHLEEPGNHQALVLFLEDEVFDADQSLEEAPETRTPAERDQMIVQLQAEIQRLREQLQITTEEYDSSAEEMKAANEELQSINEEYRSATEELETSKEELQSVNEELQTVNTEMRSKLEEVSRAHKELENLMGATEIATLYLDRELRIQRFTAGVRDLFNMMEVDRGRRISDLTHKLGYDQLVDDTEHVLRKLSHLEREIRHSSGKWYLLRLRPYRTIEDRIEGVVATFIDITVLKQTEQELNQAKTTLEEHVTERTRELAQANEHIRQVRDMFFTLFHSNPIPTSLTRMSDGTFLNVNDAYLEFSGWPRNKLLGHTSRELDLPINPSLRPRVIAQLQSEGMIRNLELHVRRASGEHATVLASIQMVPYDQEQAILLAFIDITDRVQAEKQIRSLAYDLTTAEQQERARISQILHDDLQQRIFAVKMQISALSDAYRSGKLDSAEVDFAQLEDWLDEAISVTRNLSIDLSPAILRGDGLTDALVWLSVQMEEQYGLRVNIQSNGVAGRFEDTLRILLFQAVREALFNVIKHTNTREAEILIERLDGHIRITIKDGGMGFDASDMLDGARSQGGLTNLRHRLRLMGCILQVESQPNVKGTQVFIDIPSDK